MKLRKVVLIMIYLFRKLVSKTFMGLLCLGIASLFLFSSNPISATEGTYTRLTAGTQEITIGLNTEYSTYLSALGDFGVDKSINSLASCTIKDSSVAVVVNDCQVYSVSLGSTSLHIEYQGLTLNIPVNVIEKYRIITDTPNVEQSNLDVYAGLDLSSISKQREEVLKELNQYRSFAKLQPLTINENLNKGAQAHANYLKATGTTGHIENPAHPLFSGTFPSMRVQSFGYPNINVSEVVSPMKSDPIESLNSLIAAPLHRIILLGPGSDETGIGLSTNHLVITPGTKRTGEKLIDRSVVLFPAEGQQNVPLSWVAIESPNPLDYYQKEGEQVGYPISISTSYSNKMKYNSATLTDSKGQSVDFYLVDSEHGGVEEAILLIPKQPLKPNEKYTVQIDFGQTKQSSEVYGIPPHEVTKTWSFTTRNETAHSLTLNKSNLSLNEGQSINLPKVFLTTEQGTIRDVSSESQYKSDSSHVIIQNGNLVGDSAGTAKVVVSYEGKIVSFTVDVLPTVKNTFSDMTSHWANDAVNWGKKLEIMGGYADNTFKPNRLVSEEEFLKMLFKLYEKEIPMEIRNRAITKTKWSIGSWSDPYYNYALSYNLDLDKSALKKAVRQKPLTRYEVASLIAGLNGKNYSNAQDAVRFLLDMGYSTGKTASTINGYQGNDSLTRAEAVQFLRNLVQEGMNSIQGRPEKVSPFIKQDRFIKAKYNEDTTLNVSGRFQEYANQTTKVTIGALLPKSKVIQEYLVTFDHEGYFTIPTSKVIDQDGLPIDELIIDLPIREDLSYQTKVNYVSTFYNVYR
ncbi:S-layer homology domain-containing protein [Paenibacillus sp. FSL K6-2862]|uniref:S-layer homology domain-containing protein n=1 Tax=Paenibacillus sp. FSL K6-2862 TaxID=2921484 RepID=UPI0030FCB58D